MNLNAQECDELHAKFKPIIVPLIGITKQCHLLNMKPEQTISTLMSRCEETWNELSETDRKEFFLFSTSYLAGVLTLQSVQTKKNIMEQVIRHLKGECDCGECDNPQNKPEQN